MQSKINNVMQNFDFKGRSGCLQYWELRSSVHNKMVLTVAGQPSRSNKNKEGLDNYRKKCLQYEISFGLGTPIEQEWFAVLAAQTGISDQRTVRSRDQFMGQLVMPVFSDTRGNNILLGVIEFVTTFPKASYVKDFNQIHNLLRDENLATKPMAKVIKVQYKNEIIKFILPLMAGITFLWGEVTQRFNKVNQKAFRINYIDHNGSIFQILSDDDLWSCVANSNSNGRTTIKMFIERVA